MVSERRVIDRGESARGWSFNFRGVSDAQPLQVIMLAQRASAYECSNGRTDGHHSHEGVDVCACLIQDGRKDSEKFAPISIPADLDPPTAFAI